MPEFMNRREMFSQMFKKASEAAAKTVVDRADQKLPPRRRPPGAVEESLFLLTCTKCEDCVKACPHGAIHLILGGHDGGTPVMVPDANACHMCQDFPCIAACGEEALRPPNKPGSWRLGRVRVLPERCIAYMGPECGACFDLCPQDAPALSKAGTRPRIASSSCVGCGLCIEACPTLPAAIELLPLEGHKEVAWLNETETELEPT